MNKDLFKSAISGTIWSIFESWGGRLISMSIFFLLARILGPEAFGLIALAGVYLSLVGLFVDQGLSAAIVQRQELENEHLDAAFWISLTIGLTLSISTFIASDFIALLFKQSELADVIRYLSITFTISALSSTQEGIVKRNLNFKDLALKNLIANVISGIVSVPLAYVGFGIWTLVVKEIVFSSTRLILLWKISDWRPRFKFSFKHYKQLLSFSINILGIQILNVISNRLDNFLIGVYFSSKTLGYYDVGYRISSILYELLVGVIQKVFTPLLSKLQQDPLKLKSAFYKATLYTTIFSLPIYCFTGIFADKIVLLILGEQWNESAIVVQILCISGFLNSIISLNESVLLAVGKSFLNLTYRMFLNSITFLCFLVAIQWGIVGIAAAHTFAKYITAPLIIFFLNRTIQLSFAKYIERFLFPISLSFVYSLILLGCEKILDRYPIPLLFSIIIPFSIASISYITLLILTSATLRADIQKINFKLIK